MDTTTIPQPAHTKHICTLNYELTRQAPQTDTNQCPEWCLLASLPNRSSRELCQVLLRLSVFPKWE